MAFPKSIVNGAALPAHRKMALVALGAAFCLFAAADGTNAATVTGAYCKMRFDVRATEVIIPDHSSLDNIPLGDITTRKSCGGPVIATFSAELTGTIHIHEVTAVCLDNAGFAGGCTAGTIRFAPPAHTMLQSNGEQQVSFPVVTARWIFPRLGPGHWRFRIFPAAFTPATVKNSAFTVEAYD